MASPREFADFEAAAGLDLVGAAIYVDIGVCNLAWGDACDGEIAVQPTSRYLPRRLRLGWPPWTP